MKPTVGRIVHYYTTDTKGQFNGQGEGPYAAIVTQVFTDDMVNLYIFPNSGIMAAKAGVCGSVIRKGCVGAETRWWEPPVINPAG